MPRLIPLFAGLVTLPVLAACNPAQIARLDPAADATASAAYRHAWKGEDAAFEEMLEPAQRGPQVYVVLGQIRALIPPGEPESAETVSWNNVLGTGGQTLTLVQTYGYAGSTVSATVVMVPDKSAPSKTGPAQSDRNGWLIRSFNVNVQAAAGSPPPVQSAPPAVLVPGGGPVKPI